MDYIVPAVLLRTRGNPYSAPGDAPPPYEPIDPEVARRRTYVQRIQYCQTAGTVLLVPVMLIVQVPFLRLADKHFSPSVARGIRRSYLRGALAGNLAFAMAEIIPYTGLEIYGLNICPQLLPNTAEGMIELEGAERAALSWPCRRERIRLWREGQGYPLCDRLDSANGATPLVRDLVSHLDYDIWTRREKSTALQGVAKFIGEALVVCWTTYQDEMERAKQKAASSVSGESTQERENARDSFLWKHPSTVKNEVIQRTHEPSSAEVPQVPKAEVAPDDESDEEDEAALLAFRGATAWD
ncbi:hypothetical protein M409DRAFT_29181 [Zasmidium cellare ATCC 36951]|uniref:Uncharacterized protein n=1 Tax=Zasmidium cellare ATCC 36951 TaxID=1080233 RepID=A0A6A6C2D1_ZASCE|nr:uncharacterized protein M409DRAFT_29181 [Zasmidium cellare ATCC 36951]KAF2160330.1 hypothetical protein M409DRAFT_29181 [Zasmidium cellare ATCC 36951]